MKPEVVAHAYNPSTQEAKASLGYTVRPCERDRVNELEEGSSKAPKINKEMLII
jgi:hypothetical protein